MRKYRRLTVILLEPLRTDLSLSLSLSREKKIQWKKKKRSFYFSRYVVIESSNKRIHPPRVNIRQFYLTSRICWETSSFGQNRRFTPESAPIGREKERGEGESGSFEKPGIEVNDTS